MPASARTIIAAIAGAALLSAPVGARAQDSDRPRARDAGVAVGIFTPGPMNAITDVPGVRVGHATRHEGDSIHTGVTAILPHGGDLYRDRVPAAIYRYNGFGKLLGVTQVRENGELETPVLLTCTLCVWRAADAMVEYLLEQPGMESVISINPVVGETNDGFLNDIRERPVTPEMVRAALEGAQAGPVAEGAVGAGAGTGAFAWKAGIGTSSRRLPEALGGYTVGILVQANFGGILTMNGAPVGRELGQYSFRQFVEGEGEPDRYGPGSIMMIAATDAPLTPKNLERLAKRVPLGLGRTGSVAAAYSGDYVIAFSNAESVRRPRQDQGFQGALQEVDLVELPYHALTPLFEATMEATEEAIYNALFAATATTYRGRTLEALPIEATLEILRKYDVLGWDRRFTERR